MTQSPTQPTYRYDVFVSYHQDDAAFVFETLLPALKAADLTVAIDVETFDPGGSILDETERAILESRHTLAVLTPSWAGEGWDAFEATVTQSQDPAAHGRKLIPLLLEMPGTLPRRIERLHWVDLRTESNREGQLQRVIDAVQGRSTLPELKPYAAYPTGWQRLWEMRLIGGVAVGVVLLLGLVGWLVWSQRPEPLPTVMPQGSYNVAVAPFTVAADTENPAATAEGEARAISIASFLDTQKEDLTSFVSKAVVVWGPQDGVAPVESGTEKQRLADLNANLLIYGTIGQTEDGDWQIEPRFVLRDPDSAGASAAHASELQGIHALGREIAYRPNEVGEGQANEAVQERLQALVLLVKGFVFFSEESESGYEEAIKAFQEATETAWGRSNDGSGQEILYLFLGYGYMQQLQYLAQVDTPLPERKAIIELGLDAFEAAHEANPEYVKAYNGNGFGYFQLARLAQLEQGGCNWDWDLLEEASLWFQDTLEAPEALKQLSGDVDMAAHNWLGRIDFTRSLCRQADAWQNARDHYRFVIDLYEADPQAFREPTAILAYRELAHTDFFNPASDLTAGSPVLDGIIDNYGRSVEIAVARNTESSLLQAQDSLAFQLNALCQDGQLDQLRPRLDAFLQNFADPLPVQESILAKARLHVRSEECQNAITEQ